MMSQVSGQGARWGMRVLGLVALLVACAPAQPQTPPTPCIALGGSFCAQPVGQTSGAQNVTIVAQVAGTVSTVEILTLGVSGLDFAPGLGAITCAGATLSAGSSCMVSVTFTPLYPGPRVGAVMLLDSQDNPLGATALSGAGEGGLAVLVTGNIVPVAGDGTSTGPLLDGSPATSASLHNPTGVVADGAGNLTIADRDHNCIRKVTAATGIITTLAGNGTAGYSGDGLASTDPGVSLNAPSGVVLDGAGNLYIADTGNNVIREILAANGTILTIAGTGQPGSSGDSGPATAALLNQPSGIALDANGNSYIADTANHRIRRVNAVTGIITTVAGNGFTNPVTGAGGYSGDGGPATQAELNSPRAVAFDPAGNLYIADTGNNGLRQVAAVNGAITARSTIATFAGTGTPGDSGDGAAATLATLNAPSGIAVDAAGNVLIADTANSAIRKVSPATGYISTIARNNTGVYVFNHGGPYAISIYGPAGLFLDGAGDLYFADTLNNRIREIQGNFGILDFTGAPVAQGKDSQPQLVILENDGNTALDLSAITPGQNTALDASATTCTTASALTVAADCAIAAVFAPSLAGDPLVGDVTVTENAPNSPLTIALVGNATPVSLTATAIASSANPSGFGQAVTLTATVASPGGATGSVTFLDGATALGATVPLNASARAAFTATSLAVGMHAITAWYGGDSTHAASTSAVLNQGVLEATATTLTSSPNPAAVGQTVTLTATVTAQGGAGVVPDGTVTFTDGNTSLATVSLGAAGAATWSTAALKNGVHGLLAAYSGDAAHQISASISNLLSERVLLASQVTLTSSPNPSNAGSAVTFTAAVQSSRTSAPTGTVAILDAGTQIGTASLANSAGTFITSSLAAGSHTITAAYLGNACNAPSTSAPLVQVVNRLASPATTTVLAASPDPSPAGTSVVFTATVSGPATMPTGTVTFLADGLSIGSAALNVQGIAALSQSTLTPGSHSVTASYPGDANHAASTALAIVQVVDTIPTTTALTATAGAVTLTAVVAGSSGPAPGGKVTYTVGTTAIGSAPLNDEGAATLTPVLAPGTYLVVASYAGDSLHAPSTSQPLSIVQAVTGFELTVAPTSLTIDSNQSALAAVSLTSNGAFSDTVALACSSLPTGVTCQFSSPTVSLAANGTVNAQLTISLNNTTALAGPASHLPPTQKAALAGFLLPVGVFSVILLSGERRRPRGMLLLALCVTALMASGCTSIHRNSSAPGACTIQVTGTGVNTKLAESQSVTLNITQ